MSDGDATLKAVWDEEEVTLESLLQLVCEGCLNVHWDDDDTPIFSITLKGRRRVEDMIDSYRTTDDEEFCPKCLAGMESSEHHEKCVVPAEQAEDQQ